MGAKCTKVASDIGCVKGPKRYDPTKDAGDLAAINEQSIKDPLKRFEKSFPLYRMHIKAFIEKIQHCAKQDFEYALLDHHFDSDVWEG